MKAFNHLFKNYLFTLIFFLFFFCNFVALNPFFVHSVSQFFVSIISCEPNKFWHLSKRFVMCIRNTFINNLRTFMRPKTSSVWCGFLRCCLSRIAVKEEFRVYKHFVCSIRYKFNEMLK